MPEETWSEVVSQTEAADTVALRITLVYGDDHVLLSLDLSLDD